MPDSTSPDADVRVAVFAPTTLLSVTVEHPGGDDDPDEVHVHAAGQGWWVARMVDVLGAEPLLCTPIGGETGTAIAAMFAGLPLDGIVHTTIANGSYVHDRRGGERVEVAAVPSARLDRHTLDDLVSTTLANGLRADVTAICGTNLHRNLDDEVFTRVCADLRAAGSTVVADLSDGELVAALAGGVDVVKVSHEELVRGEWATGEDTDSIIAGIRRLLDHGAKNVVVSRATDGVLAALEGGGFEIQAPTMSVVDPHGAGDSMTAGIAVGIARGLSLVEAVRLGTAAAALNVTRHGLASGNADAIEQLRDAVEVRELAGLDLVRPRGDDAGSGPHRSPRGC